MDDIFTYIPKTNTQKKIFDKLINELNTTNTKLIGVYSTITTTTRISLICGECGNKGDKKYKQIFVSKGLCHTCTQKNKMKKLEEISLQKYGVQNISQASEIKQEKRNTAITNGYIYTKELWLLKIKETGLDRFWKYEFDEINGCDNPHPMIHIPCNIISYKSPRHHLRQDNIDTEGQGCVTCYCNSRRLTKNDFINQAQLRFGKEQYNYENVPDIIPNNHTDITLVCNDHGEFQTKYSTHLYGCGGCLPCSNNMKTKREIIELYLEEIEKNNVILQLDNYEDYDIIKNNQKIPCLCKINPSHEIWYATLSNLRNGSRCPHKDCVQLKISNTNILRHGVRCGLQMETAREALKKSYIENKEDIDKKRRETCKKNHGVEHPLQSLEIQERMQKHSYLYKDYKTPSGNIIRIQGFEYKALDELYKIYLEDDIITSRTDIPIIFWNNGRRYFPDIFIKSKNMFIEVKSTWTFSKQKEETLEKAKACILSKYNIEIWVYDNNNKEIICVN